MTKLRKTISIVLAVIMIMSVAQISVFAAEFVSPANNTVVTGPGNVKVKIKTQDFVEGKENYCEIKIYSGDGTKLGYKDLKYTKKGQILTAKLNFRDIGSYVLYCICYHSTENGFVEYSTGKWYYLNGKILEAQDVIRITVKRANTLSVKTAAKSLKASALKKAQQTVNPVSIKKARGKVTVKKIKKGTTSKIYKKITIAKKTGAITFKKGTYKRGTYKVKLKVTAAGNDEYTSKSKTVTVKIKVK